MTLWGQVLDIDFSNFMIFYKENNIEITIFFDDEYIIDLYIGKRNIRSILTTYIKRFFTLFSVKEI